MHFCWHTIAPRYLLYAVFVGKENATGWVRVSPYAQYASLTSELVFAWHNSMITIFDPDAGNTSMAYTMADMTASQP